MFLLQEEEMESVRNELLQVSRKHATDAERSNSRLQELASAVERMSAGFSTDELAEALRVCQNNVRELSERVEQMVAAQTKMEQLRQEKEQGTMPRIGVTLLGAENLPFVDLNQKPDPYCTVTVGGEMIKSKIARKTVNPVWGDAAELLVETMDDVVRVRVYDWEVRHAHKLMGWADVSLDKLKIEGHFEDNLPLYKEDGNMLKGKDGVVARVRISLTYSQGKMDLPQRVAECEDMLKKMFAEIESFATKDDLDAVAKQPVSAVQQQVAHTYIHTYIHT
jgi:hypothetical protein